MKNHLLHLITATIIVLGLQPSAAMAQPGPPGTDVPPVPPNIEAPAGHSAFLAGHAVGTQNFICLPSGTGAAWKFLAPQATLFRTFKGQISQQIITHYLSANASENNLPRPAWQHSLDSSRAFARVLAASDDAYFVEAGAIPWLLLEVTGSEFGPTNGASLARTTYIQRLNTSGGIAPSTGCSQSAEIGAVALVPYTADYFFYRADPAR
jgi:Protein of unknown function (DUF3455)